MATTPSWLGDIYSGNIAGYDPTRDASGAGPMQVPVAPSQPDIAPPMPTMPAAPIAAPVDKQAAIGQIMGSLGPIISPPPPPSTNLESGTGPRRRSVF